MSYGIVDDVAYVLSGNGGKADAADASCKEGDWHIGGISGFVRGLIDSDGVKFEYRDSLNNLLYVTEAVKKRNVDHDEFDQGYFFDELR
ncbi:hypothetical protein HDU92_008095 [Lobulomyces angularis]|nr:hypothetical protein HDU92_008095 [Lobulomyces angularis]